MDEPTDLRDRTEARTRDLIEDALWPRVDCVASVSRRVASQVDIPVWEDVWDHVGDQYREGVERAPPDREDARPGPAGP